MLEVHIHFRVYWMLHYVEEIRTSSRTLRYFYLSDAMQHSKDSATYAKYLVQKDFLQIPWRFCDIWGKAK
jgi:hypothetical protein